MKGGVQLTFNVRLADSPFLTAIAGIPAGFGEEILHKPAFASAIRYKPAVKTAGTDVSGGILTVCDPAIPTIRVNTTENGADLDAPLVLISTVRLPVPMALGQ